MIVLTTQRPEIISRIQTEGTYTTLTLATFKEHLKWGDDTSEDVTMQLYLTSAIKQAEAYTRRAIDLATYRTYLDSFYNFTFDIAPIVVAGVAVSYYNSSDVLTTLPTTEYTVKDKGRDSYAEIEFTGTMPELYDRYEPVYVQFQAGYSTYPADLAAIILQQAADYFENRTNDQNGSLNEVTFGFHKRLFPYKIL